MTTDTTSAVRGSYGSLEPGKGYLVGQDSIGLEPAQEAVEEADALVDEVFADFDRSSWTEGHPRGIARGWRKIAAGEYFDRIQGANVSDEGDRGKRLRQEGQEILLEIVASGGPVVNGKRQGREDEDDPGDRSIRIKVT